MTIFEIEIWNLNNGNHGYKFVEAPDKNYIYDNEQEFVGENVAIGKIYTLKYKTLREARAAYKRGDK